LGWRSTSASRGVKNAKNLQFLLIFYKIIKNITIDFAILGGHQTALIDAFNPPSKCLSG